MSKDKQSEKKDDIEIQKKRKEKQQKDKLPALPSKK